MPEQTPTELQIRQSAEYRKQSLFANAVRIEADENARCIRAINAALQERDQVVAKAYSDYTLAAKRVAEEMEAVIGMQVEKQDKPEEERKPEKQVRKVAGS